MFDKRVVRRNIAAGRVSTEEYQSFLQGLRDASANIKAASDGGDDDGFERPAAPVSAPEPAAPPPPRPPESAAPMPAPAPASFSNPPGSQPFHPSHGYARPASPPPEPEPEPPRTTEVGYGAYEPGNDPVDDSDIP